MHHQNCMLSPQKINSGKKSALPLGHLLMIRLLEASSPPSLLATGHFSLTLILSSTTTTIAHRFRLQALNALSQQLIFTTKMFQFSQKLKRLRPCLIGSRALPSGLTYSSPKSLCRHGYKTNQVKRNCPWSSLKRI